MDDFGGMDDMEGGGGTMASVDREPMFPPPHGNRGALGSAGGGGTPHDSRPTSKGHRGKARLGASMSKSASDFRGMDGGDEEVGSGQYRALVERLEGQLQAERRMVKQLRAHAVATSVSAARGVAWCGVVWRVAWCGTWRGWLGVGPCRCRTASGGVCRSWCSCCAPCCRC